MIYALNLVDEISVLITKDLDSPLEKTDFLRETN